MNRMRCVGTHPAKTSRRVRPVADEVAEKKERVRRLFHRVQRGKCFKVRMEIAKYQDSHGGIIWVKIKSGNQSSDCLID